MMPIWRGRFLRARAKWNVIAHRHVGWNTEKARKNGLVCFSITTQNVGVSANLMHNARVIVVIQLLAP
jgi:hypothetical protein